MKKVIFSALTFLMLSTVAVFAQDAGQTSPVIEDQDQTATDIAQEQRTEVSLQELPEEVSNTLQQEYEEWTPTATYLVTSEEEGEHFAVELQKDGEAKTVKFDSQGNKIDKEEENTAEDLE